MEVDTSDISERKDRMTEKLQKRHDGRIAELEKKREEQDVDESKKTSIDYFYKTFQVEKSSIETGLEDLCRPGAKLPKVQLTDRFDALIMRVKKLQKFIADYTAVLPSYDINRSQSSASELLSTLQRKREEMIPKKKFAFKSRKKESEGVPVEEKPPKEDGRAKSEVEPENAFVQDSKGFSDRSSECLRMAGDEIKLQDISLSNLKSCKVTLEGYPSAVHVNNLKDCKVFCGPVPGSIFVDNCESCVFVVACQQLRVHHTKDTQFYLQVTSRAIIEDTTTVLFAPYQWDYATKDEDYRQSGLDPNRNNWDDVDDFNWLASDKHSPNWGILPESQRVQKWD
ncbi:putative tubulin-specific chaperone C-like [Apostichopus japonicus]|uniref:Putative tubulin-specific chaperone C-like n=1 Tax=Stichopus japonicus TaxID=307972 RepID=A0A2G8JXK7_STIJA|nr:putative tubulin-specific chaperone C-like [Apostichopus japonicus]